MQDPDKVRQVLEPLEKSLAEDYPQQDLVRQREALLELLGNLRNVLRKVQYGSGLSHEEIPNILQPITDWYGRHASVFPILPSKIQVSINVVTAQVRLHLEDQTLKLFRGGVIEGLDFYWSVLEGYEILLRRSLVKFERVESAKSMGSPDSSPTVNVPHSEGAVGELNDDERSTFRHSPDYRSVNLRGREFTLTLNQARVVHELHNAHRNSTPEVSEAYLLEKLDIKSSRLRDAFRGSESWGKLVVQGRKRGTRRLNI